MSDVVSISTHVLDTTLGSPAAGIPAILERCEIDGTCTQVGSGITSSDGRVPALVQPGMSPTAGRYRIRFDVGGYFAATGREAFYDVITIEFRVSDARQHYHVPLLLSPFGYATYRGS